jgi:hypothetical protein
VSAVRNPDPTIYPGLLEYPQRDRPVVYQRRLQDRRKTGGFGRSLRGMRNRYA